MTAIHCNASCTHLAPSVNNFNGSINCNIIIYSTAFNCQFSLKYFPKKYPLNCQTYQKIKSGNFLCSKISCFAVEHSMIPHCFKEFIIPCFIIRDYYIEYTSLKHLGVDAVIRHKFKFKRKLVSWGIWSVIKSIEDIHSYFVVSHSGINSCVTQRELVLTASSGYLASYMAAESRLGTGGCPWVIKVQVITSYGKILVLFYNHIHYKQFYLKADNTRHCFL